jgi:hypothetical protein
MSDLRFPVGPEPSVDETTSEERASWIAEIAALPGNLRAAVAGLDAAQLATPYRVGGWTVRQVVHHLADGHMNAYIRTKFALTMDRPTIMPYDENAWAGMTDASDAEIERSLTLLEGLHARWAALWRGLGAGDWKRLYLHPERGPVRLEQQLGSYAWHCRHHVAHITSLRQRNGW